jgi:hypothetical protein
MVLGLVFNSHDERMALGDGACFNVCLLRLSEAFTAGWILIWNLKGKNSGLRCDEFLLLSERL